MINENQLGLLRRIVEEHTQPVVFATVSGAHLYGFASPDSDIDLRGLHVKPLDELVGLDATSDTVDWTRFIDGYEVDLVTHDVGKFFLQLLKRDGSVLEQVMSPLVVTTSEAHQELIGIAPQCMTKHHANHYLGFARSEWGLVSKSEHPKVKPLLYVYRVLLTGLHLMREGSMEMDLRKLIQIYSIPEVSELVQFKTHGFELATLDAFDREHHHAAVERLVGELEQARDGSHLPDAPSARPTLNDLLLRLRLG